MTSKKIYIMGYGRLGNWSLSEDTKHLKSILEEAGFIVVKRAFKADIIISPWHRLFLKKRSAIYVRLLRKIRRTKVISYVTHITTSLQEEIKPSVKIVDWWIVPNKKELKRFKKNNFQASLIPFHVDQELFRKIDKTKKEICKELGIDYEKIKGKFLIGSFQRDSLGKNLSLPKIEKNPDLLIKILEKLPKEIFLLVLSSPRRHYLINKCKELNIPYFFYGKERYIEAGVDDLVKNNIDIEKIPLLYNLVDLYIVSSKVEGGPKSILEASLIKTLIVSTDVGLASDILHPDLIYSEEGCSEIVELIKKIIVGEIDEDKFLDFNNERVRNALNRQKIIDEYKKIIECIS